jgi:hypothetical protein
MTKRRRLCLCCGKVVVSIDFFVNLAQNAIFACKFHQSFMLDCCFDFVILSNTIHCVFFMICRLNNRETTTLWSRQVVVSGEESFDLAENAIFDSKLFIRFMFDCCFDYGILFKTILCLCFRIYRLNYRVTTTLWSRQVVDSVEIRVVLTENAIFDGKLFIRFMFDCCFDSGILFNTIRCICFRIYILNYRVTTTLWSRQVVDSIEIRVVLAENAIFACKFTILLKFDCCFDLIIHSNTIYCVCFIIYRVNNG